MAKRASQLTALEVKQLTRPGHHRVSLGLYLTITPENSRSWTLRYSYGGRDRWMGLGPCAEVPLATAREKARQYREQAREGVDPIEARRAKKVAVQKVTVAEAGEAYINRHKAKWRSKTHLRQWEQGIADYVVPLIGKRSIAEIDTSDVVKVLEQAVPVEGMPGKSAPLYEAKAETASRVRSRLEQIIHYAETLGWRPRGSNPATWRGNLQHIIPGRREVAPVEHLAAVPWQELPNIWSKLEQLKGIIPLAIRWLLLTGCRLNECLGAEWSEIQNINGQQVWVVPEIRTKRRKAFRVPLSSAVVELLEELEQHRQGNLLFPGKNWRKPLAGTALRRTWAKMAPGYTLHGCRASLRTWMAETTSTPRAVAEMCLGHSIEGMTESAYQRGDYMPQRAPVMQSWSDFITNEPAIGKIVPIVARKAG